MEIIIEGLPSDSSVSQLTGDLIRLDVSIKAEAVKTYHDIETAKMRARRLMNMHPHLQVVDIHTYGQTLREYWLIDVIEVQKPMPSLDFDNIII